MDEIVYECPVCQHPYKTLNGLRFHFHMRHPTMRYNNIQAVQILNGRVSNPSKEKLGIAALSYMPKSCRNRKNVKKAIEIIRENYRGALPVINEGGY